MLTAYRFLSFVAKHSACREFYLHKPSVNWDTKLIEFYAF